MTALPRLLLSLALALGGQAALAHTGNCHFHGKTVASATTVTACADERKRSRW